MGSVGPLKAAVKGSVKASVTKRIPMRKLIQQQIRESIKLVPQSKEELEYLPNYHAQKDIDDLDESDDEVTHFEQFCSKMKTDDVSEELVTSLQRSLSKSSVDWEKPPATDREILVKTKVAKNSKPVQTHRHERSNAQLLGLNIGSSGGQVRGRSPVKPLSKPPVKSNTCPITVKPPQKRRGRPPAPDKGRKRTAEPSIGDPPRKSANQSKIGQEMTKPKKSTSSPVRGPSPARPLLVINSPKKALSNEEVLVLTTDHLNSKSPVKVSNMASISSTPPPLTLLDDVGSSYDFSSGNEHQPAGIALSPVKTYKRHGSKKRAKTCSDLFHERKRQIEPTVSPPLAIEYYNDKNRPLCPICDGDTEYETSDDEQTAMSDSDDEDDLFPPRYQTFTTDQERSIWRKKFGLKDTFYTARTTNAKKKHARDKIQCNQCAQWFHFTCMGGPNFFLQYQKSNDFGEFQPICGECKFRRKMILEFTTLKEPHLAKEYFPETDRVRTWR